MDCAPHHARPFYGLYLHPLKNSEVVSYLILNALEMPILQFDVNVVKCVAIDVANDELPVWWIEVYSKRFIISREKGRDLTQSHDKSPNTDRKIQKAT